MQTLHQHMSLTSAVIGSLSSAQTWAVNYDIISPKNLGRGQFEPILEGAKD
jgi:hypothetical protein